MMFHLTVRFSSRYEESTERALVDRVAFHPKEVKDFRGFIIKVVNGVDDFRQKCIQFIFVNDPFPFGLSR